MSRAAEDEVLAAVAYDRARVFSRLTAVAVGFFTFAAELVGMPLTRGAFAIDVAIMAILVAIVVITSRRMLLARGHVLLAMVWGLTAAATLQSLVANHQTGPSLLVILEILGIAVMLQSRLVVVLLAALGAVYVPFLIVSQIPGWHAHLAGAAGATALAIAYQRVFRAAILDAELRRRAQLEVAAMLEFKLAEIERSRAAREALAQQLTATERIEATGTLAASFAHQMNNILTGITMSTSLLVRRGKPVHRADYNVLLSESQRGSDLTRALLAFSRRSTLAREACSFDEIVRSRCELIARMLPRTVQLEPRLAAPVDVSCDVVQIGQLLMNLVMNAADALDGKGTVVVESAVVDVGGVRHVRLCVEDQGRGMDEATRTRVFDPFFTTKPGAKGMGLPTAWGIVRAHDGTIQLESEAGAGTRAIVQMPTAEPP